MKRHCTLAGLAVATALLGTAGAVLASTDAAIRGNAKANTLRGTAGNDVIWASAETTRSTAERATTSSTEAQATTFSSEVPEPTSCRADPGNDKVVGGPGDKAAADCEHVSGIPKPGGSGTPPHPKPACSNGVDDDGDGLIDSLDPGCDSADDNDETDPPEPPAPVAGAYCGFTEQGPGLCVTTDGLVVTTFQTSAIVDCSDGSRWTWTVTFTGRSVVVQSDYSFSYSYSGPLNNTPQGATNIQASEFVQGTFTTDGKATGTFAISHISWDENGQHYDCTQNPVGWHTTKQ